MNHRSPVFFPVTPGPYAVGTKVFHLIDHKRRERLAPPHSTLSKQANHRELLIKMYYPAEGPKKTSKLASHIQYWEKYLFDAIDSKKISQNHLNDFGKIYTFSSPELPLKSSVGPFPLIVFSPGYDSGPYAYTAFCEGLASIGYIICFINHTYAVSLVDFPDGRRIFLGEPFFDHVIETCTQDVSFVLTSLALIHDRDPLLMQTFALEAFTLIGHSLGGMVSLHCAQQDLEGMLMGISLDGSLDPSMIGLTINQKVYDATQTMTKPFLHILAGNHQEIYGLSTLSFYKDKDIHQIIVPNSSHDSFSDYGLYKELIPWLSQAKSDIDTGSINGFVCINLVLEHIRTFLYTYGFRPPCL